MILRVLLGDQLTRELIRPGEHIVMFEVAGEAEYVPHHKQKLVLVLSAMRHFAAQVGAEYVRLDDPDNTGSLRGEIERAIARHRPDRVVMVEPGEWRVREQLSDLVEFEPDPRFLCSTAEFADWAEGRSTLRMETFYRMMRRRTGWLMDGDQPVGGTWNYDHENRKRLPASITPPSRLRFGPDADTEEVIDLVNRRYPDNFGSTDDFGWAVTRTDALQALDHFVTDCLPTFGDFQDAMRAGDAFLFHAMLSPYLNVGLLTAREVCEAAVDSAAPLNCVEGFVRQILGWREYVRGIYWTFMPEYSRTVFGGTRPLPDFYWTGQTDLNCVRDTVDTTRRHGYAHHIQRLMVTGNFALLAGIDPAEVEQWYLSVYVDAFEWVELPNTHGMSLYADGGLLASKPYAASGAYINRMSDYCRPCRFDPKVKSGPTACPFNYLYWNFLLENEEHLSGNPRMGMPYRHVARMTTEDRDRITSEAAEFLAGLNAGSPAAD